MIQEKKKNFNTVPDTDSGLLSQGKKCKHNPAAKDKELLGLQGLHILADRFSETLTTKTTNNREVQE